MLPSPTPRRSRLPRTPPPQIHASPSIIAWLLSLRHPTRNPYERCGQIRAPLPSRDAPPAQSEHQHRRPSAIHQIWPSPSPNITDVSWPSSTEPIATVVLGGFSPQTLFHRLTPSRFLRPAPPLPRPDLQWQLPDSMEAPETLSPNRCPSRFFLMGSPKPTPAASSSSPATVAHHLAVLL